MKEDTLEWLISEKIKRSKPPAEPVDSFEIFEEKDYMNLLHKEHLEEKSVTVTFVQGFYASVTGVDTKFYKRGQVAEFPESTAEGLLRDCVAVKGKVDEKKLPEPRKADDTMNKLDNSVKLPPAPHGEAPHWNEEKPVALNEPEPANPLNFDHRGPKDSRDDKESIYREPKEVPKNLPKDPEKK